MHVAFKNELLRRVLIWQKTARCRQMGPAREGALGGQEVPALPRGAPCAHARRPGTLAPASGPSSCAPCAPLAPRLQRGAKHPGHLLQPPGNEAAARALASTRGGQRQCSLRTQTGGRTSGAGPQGRRAIRSSHEADQAVRCLGCCLELSVKP